MAATFPGADPWVPEKRTLTSLREAVQGCHGCDLYRDATQAVMGSGRRDATLVLVGEQPGDREDIEGAPFVGPAGRLLDRALADAGVTPEDTYLTNAVKHFRFERRRGKQRLHKSPSGAHVAACRPWLAAELEAVRPRGVVVLGGTAGKAVFGGSFRVGEQRGRLLGWPDGALGARQPPEWVLATTHPAAVLRSREREETYAALVADLRVAAEALGGAADRATAGST